MMKPGGCTCTADSIDPSQDLFASGRVHIFIALNLRNYARGIEKMDFERLRGGEAFARELRRLRPADHFLEDKQEQETTTRGHDFQVFRGHLAEHWLFPTFHLQKQTAAPPRDVDAEDWAMHEYHVRLSRTGFLEVRITRRLPEAGESIVDLLRGQLELSVRGTPENRRSLQVRLAMHCANLFVRELREPVSVSEPNSNENVVFSLQEIAEQADVPYRQRYMTMLFSKIVCRRCGKRLEADRLRTDHWSTLAALLEGVLVEQDGGRLSLPEMDREGTEITDLASWRDDLCIFAPERALIYIPEKRIYLFGQTGKEAVPYERYWECIARGIEHTITIRAAMQIIEYETTKHLDIVPALTKKVVDGSVTDADKKEISQMSQEVANTFNLLPLLRDVLVPTSSYRASYAIRKFEHLSKVLNIRDIEEHVDHNVEELVTFVQFFASMKLEDELNRNEDTINRVGIVLGFVALMVAAPSFLSDYRTFFIETYGWDDWTEWVVFAIIGCVAATLILRMLAPDWFKKATGWLRGRTGPKPNRTSVSKPV
ncbi:MAG TPA: hypothetical protein VK900_11160 [Anaerolineales bacterium]|nr:hypothetical protein [Anaerolineales bacterium]